MRTQHQAALDVGRAAGTGKLVYRMKVRFAISYVGETDVLVMDFNP